MKDVHAAGHEHAGFRALRVSGLGSGFRVLGFLGIYDVRVSGMGLGFRVWGFRAPKTQYPLIRECTLNHIVNRRGIWAILS